MSRTRGLDREVVVVCRKERGDRIVLSVIAGAKEQTKEDERDMNW